MTAIAVMDPLVIAGVTIGRSIDAWDARIAGNNLDGSFTYVFSTTTATGTATMSASLLQMTRQ